MSTVYELEEYDYNREIDVKPENVHIMFDHTQFSWGFKIK